MKWNITEIEKKKFIKFDEKLNLTEALKTRSNEILDCQIISANGQISYEDSLYLLEYQLETVVTLPSSRSLAPVKFPLDVHIFEQFSSENSNETEENLIISLETDEISLDDSILDNILLEIPLQILTEEEKLSDELPSGNKWKVISEEEYQKQQEDKKAEKSPFAGLSGLFDEE